MGILEEIAKMSPEERAQARALLGPSEAKPVEEKRTKNPPEVAKAGRVYFFLQIGRFEVERIEKTGDKLMKHANRLPDRVIAVDEKNASKIFWKQRNCQYLGRSEGLVWRRSRNDGKSVTESQALEFEEMRKAPDMTPPPQREKTFFAGTKIGSAARGSEIPWTDGLRQQGGG